MQGQTGPGTRKQNQASDTKNQAQGNQNQASGPETSSEKQAKASKTRDARMHAARAASITSKEIDSMGLQHSIAAIAGLQITTWILVVLVVALDVGPWKIKDVVGLVGFFIFLCFFQTCCALQHTLAETFSSGLERQNDFRFETWGFQSVKSQDGTHDSGS